MFPSSLACDLNDFPLDIFGQQPRINRLYTQITFCFPVVHEKPDLQSEAINTLKQGVQRLSTSFPWVAGKVIKEHGIYKIKPREDTLSFVVKDLSMLDECTIAPVKTLSDDSAPELPVFLVQANLIAGGLLVTFNGQHGSMDVAGLGEVIRLLAKACRNEPFTSPELSVGNMNRKSIIPLFNGDKSSNEDDGQAHTSANERAVKLEQSQLQAPSFSWAYFLFSAASLGTLKSEAMSIVPTGSFVSTDDVLSVIVWQSINRARLPRLGVESSLKSTLSRNIDMRRYLSIPLGYPGLLTSSTSHSMMVDVLVKKSLGSLAADLRSALEPKSLADRIRASATQIENGGPAKANFASTSSPELDVRLSSWAKEKCYELDFGLAPGIGRPEAVRRPRFVDGAREGLVYFLPKRTDGEIVVGICLRDDDLEMLRTDAELAKYATHLG